MSATIEQPVNVTGIGQLESLEAYSKHTFSWTIHNFNDVYQKIIVQSPPFCTKFKNNDFQFHLEVQCDSTNDWLSVYFKSLNNTISIHAILNEVGIFDCCNSIAHVSNLDTNCFTDLSTSNYCLNLIKKAELFNKSENYLVDNALKIYCEIIFFDESSTYKKVKSKKLKLSHKLKHLSKFEKLFNDEKYSDVHFTSGNKILYAHKNILAAASAFFVTKFESNEMENEVITKLEVKDFDVMKEMLNYIYSGETNEVSYSTCISLLKAASDYQLEGLKELFENKLCDNLKMIKNNSTNIYQMTKNLLGIAHDFHLKKLKTLCEEIFQECLLTAELTAVDQIKMSKDLLVEAHKYELGVLKTLCETSLCEKLDIENVLERFNLAYLYKGDELKKATINFIIKNKKALVNQSKFSDIIKDMDISVMAEVCRVLIMKSKSHDSSK